MQKPFRDLSTCWCSGKWWSGGPGGRRPALTTQRDGGPAGVLRRV